MAILQWDTWYETGIVSIDHQHYQLFSALNRLHEAIATGVSAVKIRESFDLLMDCTTSHFRDEETCLATINYPGLPEHQAEHTSLLNQVAAIMTAYEADPTPEAANRLALFLVDWLVRHINVVDRQYVGAMKAMGVK